MINAHSLLPPTNKNQYTRPSQLPQHVDIIVDVQDTNSETVIRYPKYFTVGTHIYLTDPH